MIAIPAHAITLASRRLLSTYGRRQAITAAKSSSHRLANSQTTYVQNRDTENGPGTSTRCRVRSAPSTCNVTGWPARSCPMSDKRTSTARRHHANHVPCGGLEEKMKRCPEEAVIQPCNRTTGGFLAWQQISSPPQFLASDIPEYENARVINDHPPLTPQWDTHECRGIGQVR